MLATCPLADKEYTKMFEDRNQFPIYIVNSSGQKYSFTVGPDESIEALREKLHYRQDHSRDGELL